MFLVQFSISKSFIDSLTVDCQPVTQELKDLWFCESADALKGKQACGEWCLLEHFTSAGWLNKASSVRCESMYQFQKLCMGFISLY